MKTIPTSTLFSQKKRLKIGTFKVTGNGFKIGERFLKIIFDNALQYKVDEVYVTIFDERPEHVRLINLFEDWGFFLHGTKTTPNGIEKVYTKNFSNQRERNLQNPKLTFPFLSKESDVYIVLIYPEYHTELFPDSILRTESPKNFTENEPHRNALSKVYISRSHERDLKPGDLIVFYRTGGIYQGVATTIGVVESVIDNIKSETEFILSCRKRSVFTDKDLKAHWNYRRNDHPFIVNFIYAVSLPKRPNLKWLTENGIIPDIQDMPRGFKQISRENFYKITQYAFKK